MFQYKGNKYSINTVFQALVKTLYQYANREQLRNKTGTIKIH